ncbi:hypothetical protein PV326_000704 [Microctonus aethiopoides]|uniref:Innexin n=1 Tax=Microctonus aethiopoides TaxID=144406 RepID=A0AA39FQ63_9HYME|nr:hypothetical protein PV326_000704 [Microctonus aethiopoides]KAK0173608.1 hypothetical protein PV328_006778 [Microctonus aethiopoides]
MFELFEPIKCLLNRECVQIDNIVFRLHSRATVLILLICSILITAKQYIGEPISCITDSSIDKEPMNAYCWIYSTFTVSKHLRGIPGRDVASPGVGQALEDDEIYHHRYYQWVCFVLGLQAVLFYTPRALWGVWERGTIALLSRDLASPFYRDIWCPERKEQLIGQIYLLDVFLEGQFTEYGPAVATFAAEIKPFDRIDPMARLFPKVTKCTLHTFGSAGSLQTFDAMCVMPLNVVNEKTFVFIWFWLIILACSGALAILYRIIVFSQVWARIYLLQAATRVIPRSHVENVVKALHFGDWFVLYQLSQNVNPIVYSELVTELGAKFSTKRYATIA